MRIVLRIDHRQGSTTQTNDVLSKFGMHSQHATSCCNVFIANDNIFDQAALDARNDSMHALRQSGKVGLQSEVMN